MGSDMQHVSGRCFSHLGCFKAAVVSRICAAKSGLSRAITLLLCTAGQERDYVQELRTLIAAMQLDPLPESVLVTIFMEGLHTGVVRTEVFRVHPSTFEVAEGIALNAEFNLKAARYGMQRYHPSSSSSPDQSNKPVPMDLSLAEEAELQAIDQRGNICRCFACSSVKHLHNNCPLRRARQAPTSRNPAVSQKSGTAR